MERFTKKSKKFVNAYEWNRDLPTKTFVQMSMNKLGELEDVEEELGIDLITLFKAVKEGIWSNHYSYLKEPIHKIEVQIRFSTNKEFYLDGGFGEGHFFKDYGKTWALTKEELL